MLSELAPLQCGGLHCGVRPTADVTVMPVSESVTKHSLPSTKTTASKCPRTNHPGRVLSTTVLRWFCEAKQMPNRLLCSSMS
ncbi:hypothetical protein PV330_09955 [Streptomyces caniscabiei]|uniref:hypothetical protein n=1 Tax=Streptomyces caniscabiei TaxID=2746961 RepID=UPI0029AC8119|nr:hypothetical protein [Streptomyces caniscabiei]MDX2600351.1 hypothetical protein [Streptomyces caniscabiei]